MDAGVKTALKNNIAAGALSGKDGAVLLSDKDSAPSSRVSSSGGFHEQADQVSLSSEARARLRNDHQKPATLHQGRGDLAAQQSLSPQSRLEKIDETLQALRERVHEATPADREAFAAQITHAGSGLAGAGEEIASLTEPAEAELLETFSTTAKSFKDLVEEFQAHFEDEERIPPSIYNQIRHLLEKSLAAEKDEHPDTHINTVA